ncbi:MAG: sulfatase [Planctomycetota bacterium]|jgi:arylsulfatase A-like enzyme|nr:sulfatase [Planctomycetota bacterium]
MRLLCRVVLALLALPAWGAQEGLGDVRRPNILWIVAEDLSPWLASYGHERNAGHTPALDALGAAGVRFTRAFAPAPVCSPCRSALILGAMQTTTGTHQHRSSRTDATEIELPQGVTPLPRLLKEAGYFTFNRGKDDYNFRYERRDLYSTGNPKTDARRFYGLQGTGHWRERPEGAPFFGQIQLRGGKAKTDAVQDKVSPQSVTVPPYLPDTPLYRRWWAHHYDTVRKTDADVARIMGELAEDGLVEDTVVFFFSDHGNNHSPRHKQFCFEGGVHVPLFVQATGRAALGEGGGVREDLVSLLDVSATTLAFAGLELPAWIEGRDLFAADHVPREFVISARDRCDYTIDRIRTVRSDRYRYIRNFLTDRPLLQPQYRDKTDYVVALREGHAEGSLPRRVDEIFFGPRPSEELYDLAADPHEMRNLATEPDHAAELARHRAILEAWMERSDDRGRYPEPAASLRAVRARWGEKCVNPEYEALDAPSGGAPPD